MPHGHYFTFAERQIFHFPVQGPASPTARMLDMVGSRKKRTMLKQRKGSPLGGAGERSETEGAHTAAKLTAAAGPLSALRATSP